MQIEHIENSLAAYNSLRHIIAQDVEEVWVLALNSQKLLLRAGRIFKGTADQCLFHPRDIFRFVYLYNATGFILIHSHPSGFCEPSAPDIKVTRQLKKSARLLQVEFVDHLIITSMGYFSFQDEGVF
ncbi:MAG: JAB domain-containing protein [Bdellovibrionales bacterium]|nr:JAB domain-containing protein [Bdellovibrionales bacterium]